MAVPQWNENSKSYLQEEKSDPKDRIDVIIGDDKDQSTFHPQFKLQRWDNEANVSFRLDHSWLPGTKVTNDELNGVITWTKKVGQNDWIARFYEDWGTPEGAYKFVELVLPAKPPTNQISFTTTSKDVNFFYQPALTPEEIAEGAERPEEVVGSYAIYSTYRGGMNDVKGKDYKTGKIGHLYRAKLIDANGDEIWADYNTDLNETGILTITVDQTWLDNAAYPVVLDPTFGYTIVGSTTYSIALNPGAICLSADTILVTENGVKEISLIKPGERVLSVSGDGVLEYDEVEKVFNRDISHYGDRFYRIFIDSEYIDATYNHKFPVGDKIVSAENLSIGDILTHDGVTKKVTLIEIVESSGVDVWDVKLKNNNLLIANKFVVFDGGE